ncbi:MAG: component of the polarisome [Thelocarpon superellum]|nr:MAG: component of the polarisome [Thelocarpon superellum]
MTGRAPTLSPESVGGGSEWSGIAGYQSRPPGDSPYSPPHGYHRGGPATPPVSSGSTGTMNGGPMNGGPMNGGPMHGGPMHGGPMHGGPMPGGPMNGGPMNRGPMDGGPMNGGPPNGAGHPPLSPGNPSPPNSIGRSSNGTGFMNPRDSAQSRQTSILEETLSDHYVALRRFLAASLRDDKGNLRPNRARDKLLRLSPVQFQELSTDVYDELLRRQASAGQRRNGPGGEPPNGPPPYLLPKTSFHPKRNQARQKLSTLPPPRFRDLATDVFYELERRFPRFAGGDIERLGSPASSFRGGYGRNGPPMGHPAGSRPGSRGPPPRGPGPSGRNGGPQFGSLSSLAPGNNEYGRPLPKTSQSNTIIPNKSTLVEDDDDQTGASDEDFDSYSLGPDARQSSNRHTNRSADSVERDKKLIAEFQSEADGLQEKVTDLEERVHEKDEEITRLQKAQRESEGASESERQEWSHLHSNLEQRLADAQKLNDSLQGALEKSQADQSSVERDLRAQLDQIRRDGPAEGGQWQQRYEALERSHQGLQMELHEQQQVTDEVRRETAAFLKEMKMLSDRSDQSWEREERLVGQLAQLEGDVKEWKSRYARAKTQVRHMRASIGLAGKTASVGAQARSGEFIRPDGLVKDVHVTKFQIAIDELLHIARSGEPSAVLEHMQSVVLSVRHITHDLGDATSGDGDLARQRGKVLARVSATANNLITAAKNFSSSQGISPVSLVDAAASHLTAAVVELLRLVKVRPSPPGELDDDGDDVRMASVGSAGMFPVGHGSLDRESVYSSISSPPVEHNGRPQQASKETWAPNGTSAGKGMGAVANLGFGLRMQEEDVEDLKIFLEDQTEHLVGSIQALVSSIRAEDNMGIIARHLGDIAASVGKVVASTDETMSQGGHEALRGRADPIIVRLSGCRSRLLKALSESERIRDPASLKEFTNQLPPLAFEIARETKELVQRIDG